MPKGLSSGHLYRLIYYSRNVVAETKSHGELETEVNAILAAARPRNQSENLTGCLMCSATGFAQVLEGTRDAVERAFDRISQDPRHTDVMMLSLTPIVRSSFPETSLALAWAAQPGGDDPLRPLFDQPVGGGPRTTTGGDVLKLLRSAVDEPVTEPRDDGWA
jgi:hypothetical protein